MTTQGAYEVTEHLDYTEWYRDAGIAGIMIQKDAGKKTFTFEVMASDMIIRGGYPGYPDYIETMLAEGECLTLEMAVAAAEAVIVETEAVERAAAEEENRMYEEMELEDKLNECLNDVADAIEHMKQ